MKEKFEIYTKKEAELKKTQNDDKEEENAKRNTSKIEEEKESKIMNPEIINEKKMKTATTPIKPENENNHGQNPNLKTQKNLFDYMKVTNKVIENSGKKT